MAVCVNVFDQFAGLLFGISTRTQPAKQLDFVRLIHRLSFGFSLKNLVAFGDCECLSGHSATSIPSSKTNAAYSSKSILTVRSSVPKSRTAAAFTLLLGN